MPHISLQKIIEQDSEWLTQFANEHWGTSTMISHGVTYELPRLPGFIAVDQNERVGVITYHIEEQICEIVSIDSLRSSQGIGTLLLDAVKNAAQRAGCTRLWLITTNDNLNALRFYQKRNFVLVAIHRDAVKLARKLKPQIPLVGENGIPLRDEIELELLLK